MAYVSPFTGDEIVGRLTPKQGLVLVGTINDLPDTVGGVITLANNAAYHITTELDLQGSRIVCGENSVIMGSSSNISILKSTGLTDPLITSQYSLSMYELTITANHAIDLQSNGLADHTLDWSGVNFINCATIGLVKDYFNCIFVNGAVRGSANWSFDGTINVIGFESYFAVVPDNETLVILESTLTIETRYRVIFSSFVIGTGGVLLNMDVAAFPNPESLIIDSVNIQGDGAYVVGLPPKSPLRLVSNSVGLPNTARVGKLTMVDNATATSIVTSGEYVKVAGTTVEYPDNDLFTMPQNNRLTFGGGLPKEFFITATITATSANNQNIEFALYRNGTLLPTSVSKFTTSGNGRVENVSLQELIRLDENDYIEIWCTNSSSTSSITVSSMSLIIR